MKNSVNTKIFWGLKHSQTFGRRRITILDILLPYTLTMQASRKTTRQATKIRIT